MTLRTRVEPLNAASGAGLVERMRRALAGAPLEAHPAGGVHADELSAVAYAVMRGVATVTTDDVPATEQVVAVMEALLHAEEGR